MPNISNNRRLALLAGCAVVALALPLMPGAIEPAQAASCGLSLNDSDATINTVGGANSGGSGVRVACGPNATATGSFATAVGADAQATAFGSNAFGNSAQATANSSNAFGFLARANGTHSTAVGASAGSNIGTAPGYTAIGAGAGVGHTLGAWSTTIGGSNNKAAGATGDHSIAIGGGDSLAGNPGAIAGGANGNDFTIAIGTGAQAGNGASGRTGAVALGSNARANAVGAVATGQNSRAIGDNSAAYGLRSLASGNGSVAFGRQSVASARASVAIGQGSVANRINTVSVGSADVKRRIMNVAPGKAANDAVTVAQLKAAVKAMASEATSAAVAVPVALEPPAVSVVRVGGAGPTIEDMRREVAELRALVRQQQQRIAQLESRVAAAAQ
jgi:hypothetical protein